MPQSEETSAPNMDESSNWRSKENIYMDGMGILKFVNSRIPKQVNEILSKNKLTTEDIQLFVFHQASKMALDSLERLLHIPSHKVYRNLKNIGNTVSASIPIALKDAIQEGLLAPGDKALLSGFGLGLSWGTALIVI